VTVLSESAVLGLALGAGFTRAEANVMVVIAKYESGWDTHNVGDQSLAKYGSRGLWQIFSGAWSLNDLHIRSYDDLFDPAVNAKCARIVYRAQGFTAWSTYNNLHHTNAWAVALARVSALKVGAPTPAPAPAPTPKGGTVTVRDAIAWIRNVNYNQVNGGAPGLCLMNVRDAFGIPAKYGSAAEASRHAKLLHGREGDVPRNRPYFWVGGSAGNGHVAITDGVTKIGGRLRVWTTDWPSPITGRHDGKWRRVPVATITKRWGLQRAGWANSLNEVNIHI